MEFSSIECGRLSVTKASSARLDGEAPRSTYREFPPPSSLKEHVLCIWTQTISKSHGSYSHLVLPDACIDIVFINHDLPAVIGPWTESFVAGLAAGTTIVGVRFHPGRASNFLGVPAHTMLNQSVALDDVSRTLRERFARIVDEKTVDTRKEALLAGLFARLPHCSPNDQAVNAAIRWLAFHPNGRVGQLSAWIGLSARQLQRRFLAAVGYGPKTFHSILRFQRLLNLAGGTHNIGKLADLAAEAGYADQAHMTREVHRFSGAPPTVVLASSPCTLCMSNFFESI